MVSRLRFSSLPAVGSLEVPAQLSCDEASQEKLTSVTRKILENFDNIGSFTNAISMLIGRAKKWAPEKHLGLKLQVWLRTCKESQSLYAPLNKKTMSANTGQWCLGYKEPPK